jgi:CHAT domain-containing protein
VLSPNASLADLPNTDASPTVQAPATDPIQQAIALSDVSLQYQQQGNWNAAEAAIHQAFAQLESADANQPAYERAIAHAQTVQGHLDFNRGRYASALSFWQQAGQYYEQQPSDRRQWLQNQLHQSMALQELRFYSDADEQLSQVYDTITDADITADPDVILAMIQKRATLQERLGQTEALQTTLSEGVQLAERFDRPNAIARFQLQQGNITRRRNPAAALSSYANALSQATDDSLRLQIQLQQLQVWTEQENWNAIAPEIATVASLINQLPSTRSHIYASLNYAKSAIEWLNKPALSSQISPQALAQQLATAVRNAQQLGDGIVESYALATLAQLYQQQEQWSDAEQLTQAAIDLAVELNAPEIAYRWYWQLGQQLKAQNQIEPAIAAYDTSIDLLQTLRQELLITNSVVQATFQDTIEPIHRELVSLLLETADETDDRKIERARTVLEALQIIQINNFLQQTCLSAQSSNIDQVDDTAAILYPVILPDRLEVIFKLPGQPLRHYAALVTQDEVEETIRSYLATLTIQFGRFQSTFSEQLYDWLIRPIASDLESAAVETLVFVPDGFLRNVPMAALSDGSQYLIEQYAVAVTPGLQLFESRPINNQQLSVLIAGLSEARQNFSALPFVESEIAAIQSILPNQSLTNTDFTRPIVTSQLSQTSFPIVHLATHGQFGGSLEDTFVLTWDDRININQLSQVLQASDINRDEPIELLVLSACQTATGDRYAALGLAGVAVQAGARSTLASLWFVNDRATSDLMASFYQQLIQDGTSRAKALQRAQIALITSDEVASESDRSNTATIEIVDQRTEQPSVRRSDDLSHPYYWASFTLIGNWL